jgi:signal transduction histidine kinase
MAYALRVRALRLSDHARWPRLAVAAAVVAAMALTLALSNCWCDPQRWATRAVLVSVAGVGFGVELAWGRWPRWAFALGVALPIGWLILSDNGSVAPLLLLLMVGWTVYSGTLRDGLIAGVLAVVAALGYVRFDTPDRWLPWLAGITATWLMMRLFVSQQHLVRQLRAAQADLERTAVAAERRRIAGEIHDVAAHALALTVLHLTGLRLRVQREGGAEQLVESLAEAERLARQSLDDIRRTVGLLQDQASGIAPPLPGATDIRSLVDQYRARGLDVDLQLHGQPESVPPAAGLALYRIVQESLANAVKHAPGSDVQVQLELNGSAHLTVRNAVSSAPAAPADTHKGHGLGGMRERARLLGGSLEAGADAADGSTWLVECVIPRDTRP